MSNAFLQVSDGGLMACYVSRRRRDSARPLGISDYQFAESLPEPLQTSLPTIEQI